MEFEYLSLSLCLIFLHQASICDLTLFVTLVTKFTWNSASETSENQ